ncbi:hypothetical protein CHS0354_042061 [Potamilus streckersoni]|uniref:Uncharacterized protein n=1 Tax=Potamilus streckersoni TaxID=2493646 RepID=A0AAE0T9U8_9BIVA|nr:hypothetical protein CHS0354_042061 [Potamilus streckersoni]
MKKQTAYTGENRFEECVRMREELRENKGKKNNLQRKGKGVTKIGAYDSELYIQNIENEVIIKTLKATQVDKDRCEDSYKENHHCGSCANGHKNKIQDKERFLTDQHFLISGKTTHSTPLPPTTSLHGDSNLALDQF